MVQKLREQSPAKVLTVLGIGGSKHTVQHMLGHKNVSTTQVYAEMADESKRESVDRITLKATQTAKNTSMKAV